MKRLIVLAIVVLASLTQIAPAQVRGIPPSVTSLAPGRQFMPGPSVTSLGPNGWSHSPDLLGSSRSRGAFVGRPFVGRGDGFRHFRGRNVVPVFVPMYAPYGMGVYPMIYTDPNGGYESGYVADQGMVYQTEPDNARSFGVQAPPNPPAQRPAPLVSEQQERANAEPVSAQVASPSRTEVEPQPKTLLIFKDGHRLEVTNYVIQGQTLFNLSDNGPRKVPLAELDLDKTVSENDNHGVEFQLP